MENQEEKELREIKVSTVIDMLDNYKTREEIYSELGLTAAEGKEMFKHPLLKGKKVKKKPAPPTFKLVNDINEVEVEEIEEDPNPVVTFGNN